MKLKNFLVFSLFILIVSMAAVSASDNVTDDVCQVQDEPVIESAVSGNTFKDIQNAIDKASANDVITLEGTYTGSGSEITINKAITIQSSTKATLDAKSKSRIFKITADNVVLKNLTLINGKSTEGGAIYATKEINVENCDFKDNKAFNKAVTYFGDGDIKGYRNLGKGGAIYTKAALTCSDSTFTANYPKDPSAKYKELSFENQGLGGAIFSAIPTTVHDEESDWIKYNPAGPLNIINCKFNKNYDSIYCAGPLTITGSSFESNIGLTISAEDNLKISKTGFLKNTGDLQFDPDSVYLDLGSYSNNLINCGKNASFTDCQFTQNTKNQMGTVSTRENATFKNCQFSNNIAWNGGAIHTANSKIINSKFTGNQAYSYGAQGDVQQGGAVYFTGTLSVVESTFKDNKASYGGAIFSDDYGGYEVLSLDLIDTNFTNNIEGAVMMTGTISVDKNGTKTSYKGVNVVLDDNMKKFNLFKVSYPATFVSDHNSGDKYTVKLVYSSTKNPLKNGHLEIYVYKNGKRVKRFYAYSNSKGNAVFTKLSTLDAGKYDIKIKSADFPPLFTYTAKITIKKIKTKVKAPKVTAKYKKTKYFKVTVKDKKTKKPIKGLKLKVKVYTGKKSKTYTIKTDKKGVAKLNTKKLKRGSHKVVIKPKDTSYVLSAKSKIRIR